MKLLSQTYFFTVIQRKVHQRIAKFCRVLSDIYLQQNNLMTHSSKVHNYMHAFYYIYVYMYLYIYIRAYVYVCICIYIYIHISCILTTCYKWCTNEIFPGWYYHKCLSIKCVVLSFYYLFIIFLFR